MRDINESSDLRRFSFTASRDAAAVSFRARPSTSSTMSLSLTGFCAWSLVHTGNTDWGQGERASVTVFRCLYRSRRRRTNLPLVEIFEKRARSPSSPAFYPSLCARTFFKPEFIIISHALGRLL